MIDGKFFGTNTRRLGYRGRAKSNAAAYDPMHPERAEILEVVLVYFVGGEEFYDDGAGLKKKVLPLEIRIEGDGTELFSNYAINLLNNPFWKKLNPAIAKLGRKHKTVLLEEKVKLADNGHFIFSAKISTQNERKAWQAVFDHVVKPLLVYSLREK